MLSALRTTVGLLCLSLTVCTGTTERAAQAPTAQRPAETRKAESPNANRVAASPETLALHPALLPSNPSLTPAPRARLSGYHAEAEFAILWGNAWLRHARVDVLPEADGVRLRVSRNLGQYSCGWWRHFSGKGAEQVSSAVEHIEALTKRKSCHVSVRDGSGYTILGPHGPRWGMTETARCGDELREPFLELMHLAGFQGCGMGGCLRADETFDNLKYCKKGRDSVVWTDKEEAASAK